MEIESPLDTGPNPHTHTDAEEWFYVLSGEARFSLGDVDVVPRTTVHSFTVTRGPLRYLAGYAPGGEEQGFKDGAEEEIA